MENYLSMGTGSNPALTASTETKTRQKPHVRNKAEKLKNK